VPSVQPSTTRDDAIQNTKKAQQYLIVLHLHNLDCDENAGNIGVLGLDVAATS